MEGFEVSNTSAISVAALQSAVASTLSLPASVVQTCLVRDSATRTLLVVGVPTSVSALAPLTSAVLSGSVLVLLGSGVVLTQSPAVLSYSVTASGVVGDPQFTGLRGQSYQVHGIDGAVYNLITSPQLHVNARFVFFRLRPLSSRR